MFTKANPFKFPATFAAELPAAFFSLASPLALPLALAAASGAASAQSSVTMFGIMDAGVRSIRNDGAGTLNSLISGGNLTSRIGFRGTEDLGGGLSAGFWLEGSLAADTGTSVIASQFFDRASYVNIKSASLGELRIGRDLTPVYITWGIADPFNQVGIGSVVTLYPAGSSTAPNPIFAAYRSNDRNAGTTGRSNNTITYYTPNTLEGFNATVSLGAREGATGVPTPATGHKYQAATVGYAKGPLSVRLGYALTNTSAVPDEKIKDLAWHAMYDFGIAKLAVAQRQYRFLSSKQNIVQLGVWVPVGQVGTLKFAYGKLDNSGTVGTASINSLDVRSLAIGYQHDLSKRTVLYASAAQLNNSAGSAVALPGGSTTGFVAGRKSKGFEAGIRHSF